MAVRFAVNPDSLNRTTTLPTITSFTMMGWYLQTTASSVHGMLLCYGHATSSAVYAITTISTGLALDIYAGSGFFSGGAVALNTWYHVAMTVSGTGANQCLAYRDGVQVASLSGNAAITGDKLWVGNDAFTEVLLGRMAAIKIWNAALTATEIAQEMRSYVPRRLANLLSWHPMLTHTDLSQFGATWTGSGTLATDQGPPIAWALQEPDVPWIVPVASVTAMPRPVVKLQAVASSVL